MCVEGAWPLSLLLLLRQQMKAHPVFPRYPTLMGTKPAECPCCWLSCVISTLDTEKVGNEESQEGMAALTRRVVWTEDIAALTHRVAWKGPLFTVLSVL